MLSSRNFRLLFGAFAVVVLLSCLWVAWQVWQVNRDLSAAVDSAQKIQSAIEQRDVDALQGELESLRSSSSAAEARTSGLTWSILESFPVFGDDAAGVRLASGVLDELAADGIEPLVTVSERIDELLPRDGAVDPRVVSEIAIPVADADRAFALADRDLAEVEPDKFVGRLDEQFSLFRDRVSQASAGLHSATIATKLLPTMLGSNESRHYLLVFQNNAEVRATGGLPGAVSYLEARGGELSIVKHVTGASFGEQPEPVLPLSKAEVELYDVLLGTYFLDANMTPDVPRAADLMRARWAKAFPAEPVDGVLMVDAVAVSYLLEATGPMVIDGIELSGDNVIDELLHRSYLRLSEPAEQDRFFARVAAAAFDKFTAGVDNPAGLLRALGRAADERRVFVHSFEETEQQKLSGTSIAGELETEVREANPKIAVTLNDTTGAKMSYFLRYEVDVTATACVDDVQSYSVKARLRSEAPADAARLPRYITGGGVYGVDPGSQLVTVRVFGPPSGQLGSMDLNGAEMELVRVEQNSRPVGMTYIQLDPGEVVDLTWTMKSGNGQSGDTEVSVTPTIEKKDSARTLESVCTRGGR